MEIILLAGRNPDAFLTDAEVLQEILHRFIAIRRWPERRPMFTEFATLMRDRIEPILPNDVELAADLSTLLPGREARDLIHLAVMRRLGVTRIVTTDRGFDGVPGIERLDPLQLEVWRETVIS